MQGFEAGTEEDLSAGPAELDPDTRDRAVWMLAAMVCGRTPEEIDRAVTDGEWPQVVKDMLGRAGEREELDAHLDLLVDVLHGAEGAAT